MSGGGAAATRFEFAPAASDYSNMIWIPGGVFRMGSDKHYPEEAPVPLKTANSDSAQGD
jgi:formylglycine-generating enzyme required for sulfatase activity